MQMFDTTATDKDTAIPKFYIEHIVTDELDDDGMPVVVEQEMVTIITAGDHTNVPHLPVRQEHKDRWPKHYEAFLKGQEPPEDGMPLHLWPGVNKGEVEILGSRNIKTVEQLANASEASLPPRLHDLIHRARTYMENASGGKVVEEMRKELIALKRKTTMLEKAVKQQKEVISAYELKEKREAS